MNEQAEVMGLIACVINQGQISWEPRQQALVEALLQDEVVVPSTRGKPYMLGPKYRRVMNPSDSSAESRPHAVALIWKLNREAQSPEEAEKVREILRQHNIPFFRNFLGLKRTDQGLEIYTVQGTLRTTDLKTARFVERDADRTRGRNATGHWLKPGSVGVKNPT